MTDNITLWLREAASGDAKAEERLLGALYKELRKMAGRHLRHERNDHTLQPTELLNEVYIRLMRGQTRQQWNSRTHFFAVASTVMRRVLVDHARRRSAAKRVDVTLVGELSEAGMTMNHAPERIIAVDRALAELAEIEPRQARVVELRFFAGLSEGEIAQVLGVASRTIKRDWANAKAWLYERLDS